MVKRLIYFAEVLGFAILDNHFHILIQMNPESVNFTRSRLVSSRKGIAPFQLGKASKVRISRYQFATMFYCKCRQMSVCNQISYSLTLLKHLLKYCPVSFGWSNDFCTGLVQPVLHTGNCLFEGERLIENPGISPYPNKGRKNCPAQTDSFTPG
jgi:hypothetical protein